MNFFGGMALAIGWILLFPLMRLVITFLHEMGHAIPALFTTKGDVHVYIGSYHDISHAIAITFGRLKIFFSFNIFDWKLGMCTHDKPREFWHQAIVILGGPTISLILVVLTIWAINHYQLSEGYIILATGFLILAIVDFFINTHFCSTRFCCILRKT